MESSNDISMGDAAPVILTNGSHEEQSTVSDAVHAGTAEHLSTIQAAPALSTTPTTATPAPRMNSVPPVQARPEKPALHGGPTRQYLNQNVTPHLLEGMKTLAMNEPEKPLAWLAEFLKERSKQVEG